MRVTGLSIDDLDALAQMFDEYLSDERKAKLLAEGNSAHWELLLKLEDKIGDELTRRLS